MDLLNNYISKVDADNFEINRLSISSVKDIYEAVGRILQAVQEWERDFRELCYKHHVYGDGEGDGSTLGMMNKRLCECKIISEEEFARLNDVVKLRNEFIHKYFLDNDICCHWDYPYDEISDKLTAILYLTRESNDWILNRLDNGQRPNVLENKS